MRSAQGVSSPARVMGGASTDNNRAQAVTRLRALPADLRSLPAWLLWRRETGSEGGKPRKVPYYVGGGGRRRGEQGLPEDRARLATFDAAVSAFERGGFDGIGLAMLPEHGLVALDYDGCVDEHGRLDPRVAAQVIGSYSEVSPSGRGLRAFWRGSLPDFKDNGAPSERAPLEVFCGKGFVTVTGNVTEDCKLFGASIEPLPDTLHAGIAARDARKVAAAREATREGQSNLPDPVSDETLADLGEALGFMAAKGHGGDYDDWVAVGHALKTLEAAGRADEAFDLWVHYSEQCENFDEREAVRKWERDLDGARTSYRAIFAQAQRMGWKNPRAGARSNDPASHVDRSDAGNCAKLVEIADGKLRFIREQRAWIHWDGHAWTRDASAPTRFALLVAEHYRYVADDVERQANDVGCPPEDRKRLTKIADGHRSWATQTRNKVRIDAMLALAERDARMLVSTEELDRDPRLLGVANGVVDLRTGQLRVAARDDLVTRRCAVPYDPEAVAPRWCRFVEQVTGAPIAAERDTQTGDVIAATVGRFRARPALARYVQKKAGYLLTGTTAEHKMFVLRGEGANGKSVLLDVLREVAGDYWINTDAQVLTASRLDGDAERASPAVARLAGARAAFASETKDGQRLDAAVIKAHTGERSLTARFLNRDPFTFTITHKIVLSTNHEPALDHIDPAMRGRLHVVPFEMQWNRPGHVARDPALPEGDKTLMDDLRGEAEGILAWMVRGAVLYGGEGLDPPAEVAGRTCAFLTEGDSLGRWLATVERCETRAGARTSEALRAFRDWCSAEGVVPGVTTAKGFSMEVVRRGVQRRETAQGSMLGIRCPDTLLGA